MLSVRCIHIGSFFQIQGGLYNENNALYTWNQLNKIRNDFCYTKGQFLRPGNIFTSFANIMKPQINWDVCNDVMNVMLGECNE